MQAFSSRLGEIIALRFGLCRSNQACIFTVRSLVAAHFCFALYNTAPRKGKNIMKTKNTFIPFLIMIVVSLALAASFFLPYASVTAETRAVIEKYPDEIFFPEVEMAAKDAADMSLLNFFNIYSYMAGNNISVDVATTCVVMISLLALFTVLIILFVILKRPVPIIVFTLLGFGVFFLLGTDFQMRKVIGAGKYDFSIAYLFF